MTVIDLVALERGGRRGSGGVVVVRGFRPDVEGLRAVAVLLVVLYHAGVPGLSGGFVGVDVFFVISGFLISSQLVGELEATGRVSVRGFYARRAKRLLPLAAVVTVASLVGTWVLTSVLQARELAVDAVWAGLFAMNVHLAREGVDYQAGEDPSALQHFWSLAIEEQFYLVWPLLLVVASLVWWRGSDRVVARRARRSGGPGGARVSRVALSVVTVVVAGASFAYGVAQTQVAQSLAYFVTPARAWELAVGALVAVNAPRLARATAGLRRHAGGWLVDGVAVAGLGAVLVVAVVLDEASAFPGYWVLVPVLGAAAVIVAGLSAASGVERSVLSWAPMQGLGKVSYGFYLWHWPMLVLAPAYFGVETLSISQALGVIVVALWVSVATFFVVEDPLRLLPAFRARPSRALAMGAALTATVVATSIGMATLLPEPRASGAVAEALTQTTEVTSVVARSAQTVSVPANLTPAVSDAGKDDPAHTVRGAADCHANLLGDKVSQSRSMCVFGDPAGERTVVLVGDSHAFQWLPGLDRLATENGWRLVSLTKGACPFYDVAIVNQSLKRDFRECYAWRESAMKRLTKEQPDVVVTTGAIFNPREGDFTRRWVTGVDTAVRALSTVSGRVLVLSDTPYPRIDVPKCLAENLDDARRCASAAAEAYSDPQRRTGTDRAAAAAGATVVDTIGWFCDDSTCPPVVGNTLVYRDNSHMTATFARFLASLLEPSLGLS